MNRYKRFLGPFGVLTLILGFLLTLGGQEKARGEVFFRERDLFDSAVTSSTDLITSLTPTTRGVVSTPKTTSVSYRLLVAIKPSATDSVVYLRVTQGATSINLALNSGAALVAGNAYTFEFNGSSAFTYNIRVGTSTTIGVLSVDRKED